jgi:hypothetical protein
MVARLHYLREVLRHAASFAGWVVGLVTLLIGGSIIGGAAWLANTHHRTLAVALVAVGVLLALIEGSYRVWVSVSTSLAAAKARIGELDMPEAKRAYIDEQVEQALGLRREFEEVVERVDGDASDRRKARASRTSSVISSTGRTRCERS